MKNTNRLLTVDISQNVDGSAFSGKIAGFIRSRARIHRYALLSGGRLAILLINFVVLWSLVELPWETDHGISSEQVAAILFSKIALFALAILSIKGNGAAKYAFSFVCLVSVVVIGFSLSSEYSNSRLLGGLSTVELVAKLGAFIAVALQFGEKFRPTTHDLIL